MKIKELAIKKNAFASQLAEAEYPLFGYNHCGMLLLMLLNGESESTSLGRGSKQTELYDTILKNNGGKFTMQTVLKIEGMSCGHCENHVKNELLEIAGVTSVEVSLAAKTATVEHEESVSIDALNAAVVEVGFEVV